MAITSKVDICNMAVSQLGNYGTVSNIDTPTKDIERTCALWYDICRQFTLKYLMPNFALDRDIVAQLASPPAFGYGYKYMAPPNCLKVLGIGNAEDKANTYTFEGGVIMTDGNYTEGMPVRFVRDIQDVNSWSPEAKLLLSQYLAAYTAVSITQDVVKAQALKSSLPAQISAASGVNAQENMPVRISHSLFREARRYPYPQNTSKK